MFHLFSKTRHDKSVSIYVPDKNKFIKLNNYREFVKANSLQIESMTHDKFSKFLYTHDPDLCVWLHKIKEEEKSDLKSACRVQFLSTFLDWCSVYYRIDNNAELPETFFHWRDMPSIDELEEACDMVSEDYHVDTPLRSKLTSTQTFLTNFKINKKVVPSEALVVRIERQGIKVKRLNGKPVSKRQIEDNFKHAFTCFQSVSDFNDKVKTDAQKGFISSCNELQQSLREVHASLNIISLQFETCSHRF